MKTTTLVTFGWKSKLSLTNKYKFKPIWTYGIQVWEAATARHSNIYSKDFKAILGDELFKLLNTYIIGLHIEILTCLK